jgi:DNA-binding FadR family transcriptional regulator
VWLTSRIKEIHENARGVYGSRRVQAELRLGLGIVVSRKWIRRLMRAAGISGLVKIKKGHTTRVRREVFQCVWRWTPQLIHDILERLL